MNHPPLSKSSLDVSGRIFVITGGSQGLGLECARHLKIHGASGLVLVSRSKDLGAKACRELNGDDCRCVHVCADLGDSIEAASVMSRAAEAMKGVGGDGYISGVVNAAATTARGNLMTETADGFDRQFAVNVRAPFLITKGFAKEMERTGSDANAGGAVRQGSVVNICSVAARGGAPFVMAYSASKAALVNMVKNNAAELAPRGIRVNGINMGQCLTDNEDKVQRAQAGSGAADGWIEKADANVPLGRILRPADVAPTVVFLLSDASTMITGSIIDLHPDFADGMCSLLTEDVRGQD
jgi:NAD(P)-dependent dehydrogenase (short-subunit alcohol dehydrogenase family)